MTRMIQRPISVLTAVVANGAGVPLNVEDYEDVVIQVATTGNTTATIKFAVSYSLKKPDFTIAASATNQYTFVQISDVSSEATPIVGATGIVLAGTDIIKAYFTNTEFIRWICPIISGFSAGSINCIIDAAARGSRN